MTPASWPPWPSVTGLATPLRSAGAFGPSHPRALPAPSGARCGAPSPAPLPTALTPAVGRGALKEHGCPCPALGSSWSGAPESQERSEGRVTSCRSPPPLAQCPALRRQLRPASTRPCLSPAGTVTGRSCHLDPGCPGSNETLRHGEEGVGAHGPGPTPGSRRRLQRPGVAGAPLRGPPPARHLVTVVAKSRDRCGLPRVATRPRQPGTGPTRCRERLSSHL